MTGQRVNVGQSTSCAPSLEAPSGDLEQAHLAHELDQQDQVQDLVHAHNGESGADLAPVLDDLRLALALMHDANQAAKDAQDDLKRVLCAAHDAGCTPEQLGEALGMEPGAVRTWLHAALTARAWRRRNHATEAAA